MSGFVSTHHSELPLWAAKKEHSVINVGKFCSMSCILAFFYAILVVHYSVYIFMCYVNG